MTRVSENSQSHALQFALNRSKRKLEDLQLQGSTLRKLNRPSDDPVSNIEVLTLKSSKSDNKQFIRNIQYVWVFIQQKKFIQIDVLKPSNNL